MIRREAAQHENDPLHHRTACALRAGILPRTAREKVARMASAGPFLSRLDGVLLLQPPDAGGRFCGQLPADGATRLFLSNILTLILLAVYFVAHEKQQDKKDQHL